MQDPILQIHLTSLDKNVNEIGSLYVWCNSGKVQCTIDPKNKNILRLARDSLNYVFNNADQAELEKQKAKES